MKIVVAIWCFLFFLLSQVFFSCKAENEITVFPASTPSTPIAVNAQNTNVTVQEEFSDANPSTPILDESCRGASTFDVELSPEACEVSKLLDRKAFLAAEVLLDKNLPFNSNDATLYTQYVRLLVHREPLIEGFIRNPLLTDDAYRIDTVLERAMALAVEFNPATKTYLSDIMLDGVYQHLSKKAESNEGYVSSGNDLLGSYGSYNKVHAAWKAIELDKEIAKLWISKFAALSSRFAKGGKSSSAMWTANLVGDLTTGADPKSDLDFDLATQAFLESIASGKSKKEILDDTTMVYVNTFEKEVKAYSNRNGSACRKLILELIKSNADIRQFVEKGFKSEG